MFAAAFTQRFNVEGDFAHGVDISGFQPDYQPVDEDQFAYIKLSEGVGFTSDEAPVQARRFTVPIGGYHFAKGRSAAAEAANYVDAVLRCGVTFRLPHALDLEDAAQPGQGWDSWALEWCDRVEQALAQPTLIYTAKWWTDSRLRSNVGGRELWVANYATFGASGPTLPVQWGEWAIWQWSSTPVAGVHLDRNVCDPQWLARFKPTIHATSGGEEAEDVKKYQIIDPNGTIFLTDGDCGGSTEALTDVAVANDLRALGVVVNDRPTPVSAATVRYLRDGEKQG